MRAEVLREWSMTTSLEALKTRSQAIEHAASLVRVQPTAGLRAGIAFSLYLSTLYVTVEAWRRFKFTDAEIDHLLSDSHRVAQLRECRDKIFHPGDANDPIQAFHPQHADRTNWAPKLHIALVRYCREHFRDFGEDNRRQIAEFLRAEDERRREQQRG